MEVDYKKHIHQHNYTAHHNQNERRTWYVLVLTVVTMIIEVTAGSIYGSMALLADGWHMGTHAAAFCITLFTYRYARKHANSDKFSYGAGKVGVLGGFTSAIALGIVAIIMLAESIHRLFLPIEIQFNQSILVAVIGLIVNVASMFLLGHDHSHHHDHDHHHSHDHNLRAAYFHVLADALTSLLAITALLIGKFIGWYWLDPIMGVVGALVITKWAWGLITQTSPILLDASIDQSIQSEIVQTIEKHHQTKVADIHIWKVSADHYAATLVVVTASEINAESLKHQLRKFDKLDHLTIEVNYC
jgi:cation diffusion facilitator family transporter